MLVHLRIFAHRLAKLIQIAHAVVVRALRRDRRIVGLHRRSSARRVVSRVEIAVTPCRCLRRRVRVAVAIRRTSPPPILAPGPPIGAAAALAGLLAAVLFWPPWPCPWPCCPPCCPCALLASLAIARKAAHLIAQPLHAIERGFNPLLRIVSLLRRRAHSLLRVMHSFFQALHSGGDFRLHAVGVGIDAAAHPVRAALNARAQIGLLHVAERVTQFGGGGVLIVGGEFARGVLQIFFQVAQIVGQFLAIVGELSAFLRSGLRSDALSERLLNAVGLVVLFLGQAAGLVGERIDLRRRLLLAHAAEQVRGFLQAVGGAARFGFALLRRRCAAHVVGGLAQPVERLLDARIA